MKEQSLEATSSPKKSKHIKQDLISSADHSLVSDNKDGSDDPSSKKYTKNIEPAPFTDVNDADNKKTLGMLFLPNDKRDSVNEEKINTEVTNTTIPSKDSLPNLITLDASKDTSSGKADPNLNKPTVEPSAAPQPQKLASTNIYAVEVGVHYGLGWNYNDTAEGRGFDPIIGFGVTHFFNTKWSFNTGIQYGSVAHLNSQKTVTTILGDFGFTRTDTIIDTRWIHYAVVPVFVGYTLNDKNSIAFGGSVGYLVNTTSDYITIYQSDFKQTVQTKIRSLGYTEGFNKINATCGIAYRRRITDKIFVTTEAHYGLLDIKNDTFFSKQKVERSSGIKFTISYSIINHK